MTGPLVGPEALARTARIGLAAAAAGLALAGCSGSEPAAEAYHPSHVEEVAGSDVKKVTFTPDGASRVGLETATAEKNGTSTVVPYASIIYDGHGAPWVYTVSEELTFLRAPIVVDRIEGNLVWLSQGPAVGTEVVTTGAAEILGAELGIGGGH